MHDLCLVTYRILTMIAFFKYEPTKDTKRKHNKNCLWYLTYVRQHQWICYHYMRAHLELRVQQGALLLSKSINLQSGVLLFGVT